MHIDKEIYGEQSKMASRGTKGTESNQNGAVTEENKNTVAENSAPEESAGEVKKTTRRKAATAKEKEKETEADLEGQDDGQNEVGFAPKTFLTPYMLLMLRDSFLHGYAIWEKLMMMGIPGLTESDRATIYRTLRQLEREGKVKSEWDTNTDGPARRVYTLTDAGESVLQMWAVGLDQYRQSLDFFFKMYANNAWINPFGLGLGGKKSDKDKK